MIDHFDIVTIKAVLVALAQQSAPLTSDIQKQLNELGENLIENLNELDALFSADPNLAEPYRIVIKRLVRVNERKGALNLVNDPPEFSNTNSFLIDNMTEYSQSTNLEKILEKLRELDTEKILQIAQEATAAEDSVEFINSQFS